MPHPTYPLDLDSSGCHSCNQLLPVHSNPSRQLFIPCQTSWVAFQCARVSEQGLIRSFRHVPQGWPRPSQDSLGKSLPTGAACLLDNIFPEAVENAAPQVGHTHTTDCRPEVLPSGCCFRFVLRFLSFFFLSPANRPSGFGSIWYCTLARL